MDLPEFLTRHEKGEIRLTGHRIDLFHMISHYNQGYSAEMLLDQYPTLNLPLIQKVIAFYGNNPADVDAYVADVQASIDRLRAARCGPRSRLIIRAAPIPSTRCVWATVPTFHSRPAIPRSWPGPSRPR